MEPATHDAMRWIWTVKLTGLRITNAIFVVSSLTLGSVLLLSSSQRCCANTCFAQWLLGLASGLILGVLHVPDAGFAPDTPWIWKLAFCIFISICTIYTATFPWNARVHGKGNRWQVSWTLAATWTCFQHPNSRVCGWI